MIIICGFVLAGCSAEACGGVGKRSSPQQAFSAAGFPVVAGRVWDMTKMTGLDSNSAPRSNPPNTHTHAHTHAAYNLTAAYVIQLRRNLYQTILLTHGDSIRFCLKIQPLVTRRKSSLFSARCVFPPPAHLLRQRVSQ